MGGPVSLEVYADAGGPTEVQRQICRTFKQAEKGLRTELQASLYAFYLIHREQYAEFCGDIEGYVEEFLPELKRSEEVWEILTPLSWVILGPETAIYEYDELNGECDTLLSWHGCWGIDHEFSVLIGGGQFLGIDALGTFYRPAHLMSSLK